MLLQRTSAHHRRDAQQKKQYEKKWLQTINPQGLTSLYKLVDEIINQGLKSIFIMQIKINFLLASQSLICYI